MLEYLCVRFHITWAGFQICIYHFTAAALPIHSVGVLRPVLLSLRDMGYA